jgi:hypothetical protein
VSRARVSSLPFRSKASAGPGGMAVVCIQIL